MSKAKLIDVLAKKYGLDDTRNLRRRLSEARKRAKPRVRLRQGET